MSTRPCVLTQPLIQSNKDVKLLQYVIANLNLKGFSFFDTHCVDFNYFMWEGF
jgi:hypothetical protein